MAPVVEPLFEEAREVADGVLLLAAPIELPRLRAVVASIVARYPGRLRAAHSVRGSLFFHWDGLAPREYRTGRTVPVVSADGAVDHWLIGAPLSASDLRHWRRNAE